MQIAAQGYWIEIDALFDGPGRLCHGRIYTANGQLLNEIYGGDTLNDTVSLTQELLLLVRGY